MVPEIEAVEFMIRELEANLHKKGWDRPAVLAMIVASDDRADFIMEPTPVQPGNVRAPSMSAAIGKMADAFNSPQINAKFGAMDPLTVESMCAVVLGHESWMVTPEQRAEHPGRRNADTPGGKEQRAVMAVDAGGRVYYLVRIRGEEPRLFMTAARGNPRQSGVAGRLPYELARLLKAMLRGCPPDGWDPGALNHLLRELKADG